MFLRQTCVTFHEISADAWNFFGASKFSSSYSLKKYISLFSLPFHFLFFPLWIPRNLLISFLFIYIYFLNIKNGGFCLDISLNILFSNVRCLSIGEKCCVCGITIEKNNEKKSKHVKIKHKKKIIKNLTEYLKRKMYKQ